MRIDLRLHVLPAAGALTVVAAALPVLPYRPLNAASFVQEATSSSRSTPGFAGGVRAPEHPGGMVLRVSPAMGVKVPAAWPEESRS